MNSLESPKRLTSVWIEIPNNDCGRCLLAELKKNMQVAWGPLQERFVKDFLQSAAQIKTVDIFDGLLQSTEADAFDIIIDDPRQALAQRHPITEWPYQHASMIRVDIEGEASPPTTPTYCWRPFVDNDSDNDSDSDNSDSDNSDNDSDNGNGNGSDLCLYIHWHAVVSHDEGLDNDGIEIFERDRSVGHLCLDVYYESYGGEDGVWVVDRSWNSNRCQIQCNPHAAYGLDYNRRKPTKSAAKCVY